MLASFSQHKLGASSPSIALRQKSIVPEWMNEWVNVVITKAARDCTIAMVTHPNITNSPYLDLGLSLWASASDSARIGDSRPSVLQWNERICIWRRFPIERSSNVERHAMSRCDVTMRCARKNTNEQRLNREQLEHKHCSCEAGKKQRKLNPYKSNCVSFPPSFSLAFVFPSLSLCTCFAFQSCFFGKRSFGSLACFVFVILFACSSLCSPIRCPHVNNFAQNLCCCCPPTHMERLSGTQWRERRRKGTKKPNAN